MLDLLAQSIHAITQVRYHGYTPCQPCYYLFEVIFCLIWIPTNYSDTDFQNGNLGKERVSLPSQIKYLSPAAEQSFPRAKAPRAKTTSSPEPSPNDGISKNDEGPGNKARWRRCAYELCGRDSDLFGQEYLVSSSV